MNTFYTSKQVIQIAGVEQHNLKYWTSTGLVEPSIDQGKGTGNRRKWSYIDLVGLRALLTLRDNGVSLQRVRQLLPKLQAYTQVNGTLKALSKSRLVVLADDVAMVNTDKELISLLKQPGQGLMAAVVLEMQGIVKDVQERMQNSTDKKIQASIVELKQRGDWLSSRAA